MMPAWVKPFVALVLGLLLLAVGGAMLGPALLDRESLRAELEAEISTALGYPTTIERIALLRLLPVPQVRLDGIRVAPPGASAVARLPDSVAEADHRSEQGELATIDAVELHAALWPLLTGELRLAEVRVEHPVLWLPVSQPLRSTQELTLPPINGRQPGRDPTEDMPRPSQQALRPTNQDGSGPEAASALGSGGRGDAGPPVVAAALPSAPGSSKPMPDAGVTSSPNAADQGSHTEGPQRGAPRVADPDAAEQERAARHAGELTFDAAPPSTANLPTIERLVVRDGELILPLQRTGERLSVGALDLTSGPIAIGQEGRLEGRFRLDSPYFPAEVPGSLEAHLSLPEPLSRLMLRPLRLHLATDDVLRAPPIDAEAVVTVELAGGRVLFDDLQLGAGALQVLGNAELASAAEGAALVGRLRVPSFDLRAWLSDAFGLVLPGDDGTWRQTGAAFALHQLGSRLALDEIALDVDAMHAQAWARLDLAVAAGGLPAGRIAVSLDRLALDRYLFPSAMPGGASDAVTGSAGSDPTPLPVVTEVPERPGALVMRLGARLIEIGGLHYRTVTLDATAEQRAAVLEAAAEFYGGAFAASLRAPAPGTDASSAFAETRAAASGDLTLDATALGVDLGALLTDLRRVSGEPAPVNGAAEIRLALRAPGQPLAALEPQSIRDGLGGEVSFAVRDGRLTLVDLRQLLTGTLGALGASREDIDQLTRFGVLSGSATGAQGRFQSNDIRLRSPFVQVDGSAAFDLPREQLALDLTAVLVDPPQGRGIKELEGIPIPIRARGDWADPRWEVDAEQALKQAARRSLQEDSGLFDQLEERTGIEGLGDGLRQILPGLLGR